MPSLEAESVDLLFADPPFNLGKTYTSKINDALEEQHYIDWSKRWITEAIKLLKPGGAFFLYNLPKWNLRLGDFLADRLTFRHWIAINMTYRLPIQGRLYPSHYSLLYYVKGAKPAIFHPDRLPIETCRHCGGEKHDYGGYKNKMNPRGVNLADFWDDIPPVRHLKYKRRKANELSLKLLDRVIAMASDPASLVFDPFGGSGRLTLPPKSWGVGGLEPSSIAPTPSPVCTTQSKTEITLQRSLSIKMFYSSVRSLICATRMGIAPIGTNSKQTGLRNYSKRRSFYNSLLAPSALRPSTPCEINGTAGSSVTSSCSTTITASSPRFTLCPTWCQRAK